MYGNVPFSLTMTMTMNIMQRMANKPAAAMAEIDSTNSRRVHRLFIIMYCTQHTHQYQIRQSQDVRIIRIGLCFNSTVGY